MADEKGSPFRDPQHPSWYTEPGSPAAQGGQPEGPHAQPANPYAQPTNPYGRTGNPYPQPTNAYGPADGRQVGAPAGGYSGHPGYASAAFPAQQPKTMSIIALVLGIVSMVTLGSLFLPQVAAVVLGHLALRREPAGRGMAIAGLVLGYVVIGLGLLFFVLFALLASTSFSFS